MCSGIFNAGASAHDYGRGKRASEDTFHVTFQVSLFTNLGNEGNYVRYYRVARRVILVIGLCIAFYLMIAQQGVTQTAHHRDISRVES